MKRPSAEVALPSCSSVNLEHVFLPSLVLSFQLDFPNTSFYFIDPTSAHNLLSTHPKAPWADTWGSSSAQGNLTTEESESEISLVATNTFSIFT